MDKTRIDFKTGKVFPWHFQLLAVILFMVAILIIVDQTILSVILLFISASILTGQSGIEIHPNEHTYREYLSFLLIKNGKTIKYPGLEKIFINTSKVNQKMYGPFVNHSYTVSSVEFNGYLKFTNGIKIHLMNNRKKDQLLKQLNKLSEFLKVKIEDNTI